MNTQILIHSIIQRIATGPELSKNIEIEEAEVAMSAILSGEIDEVQAAIFARCDWRHLSRSIVPGSRLDADDLSASPPEHPGADRGYCAPAQVQNSDSL